MRNTRLVLLKFIKQIPDGLDTILIYAFPMMGALNSKQKLLMSKWITMQAVGTPIGKPTMKITVMT